MRIRMPAILLAALGLLACAFGQQAEPPKSTDALLAAAKQEARAQKKSLFVIFHASW